MKAVIEENEIRIIPEDANEEYALRQWTASQANPQSSGFVLEVQAGPRVTHGHRYRFTKDDG